MSMSNGYDVEFDFAGGTTELTKLFKSTGTTGLGVDPAASTPSNGGYLLKVLCDEAPTAQRPSSNGTN